MEHTERPIRTRFFWDIAFFLIALAIIGVFTTRYQMGFRLDDVLLMDWAHTHSPIDAFSPEKGQIVKSVRPMFALTAWILTHTAGWQHPFWWQLTLTITLLTGLTFAGLTARYLSGRWYALQLSIALYFLVFTSILNVFFWYSDLTFGLELAFTTPAWYFGLRGLYEGRLKFWLIGILSGCFAVLSKEPAVVLVHVVLLGSLAVDRKRIIELWRRLPRIDRAVAIAAYVVLIFITIWIVEASPTRTNRFFSLIAPDLGHFIWDRILYYSSIYLSIGARVFLFFPIVSRAVGSFAEARFNRKNPLDFLWVSVLSLIGSIVLFSNILIALPMLTLAMVAISVSPNAEMIRARRFLPFLLSLLLAAGTLLITIQLVKTQLTEIAIITSMIAAWAWCAWMGEFITILRPWMARSAFRKAAYLLIALVAIGGVSGVYPKFHKQEHLLRDVRDVRRNANDAIQWAALHLPHNSLFAVTSYSLYGIEELTSLTSSSDETKLREQYTFAGGYVYYYLEQAGRRDIGHAYLGDSNLVSQVFAGMRREPNAYVFLQSALDLTFFHDSASHPALLTGTDSLVASFRRGPYPCEIWKLGP